MTAPDQREVIPGGEQLFCWEHLIPIAKVLIQRGHLPVYDRHRYGFSTTQGKVICFLTHPLTEDDWAAVTERFVIPGNVVYRFGMIRDRDNGVQIQGNSTIDDIDGVVPIEQWEANEDWSDLPADVASAADHLRRRD